MTAAGLGKLKSARRIGYARVSTDEQNLRLQIDALRAAGCDKIFRDKGISGKATDRPGLNRVLKALRRGDVLVVWRLDRLGRSLQHLIELVHDLGSDGRGFQSLTEAISTDSASGRLFLHMMGALAEFERSLIAERTKAGLEAARRRGKRLGRPPLMNEKTLALAVRLIGEGAKRPEVAAACGVSTPTLYRELARRRDIG